MAQFKMISELKAFKMKEIGGTEDIEDFDDDLFSDDDSSGENLNADSLLFGDTENEDEFANDDVGLDFSLDDFDDDDLNFDEDGGDDFDQNLSLDDNDDSEFDDNLFDDDDYNENENEDSQLFGDDENPESPDDEQDPNYQGMIRTVKGANLVYKRASEDGDFEELWIYNIGKDIKRETKIRRAILAGTDIDPSRQESDDGMQKAETKSMGNVQFLHITGLQN